MTELLRSSLLVTFLIAGLLFQIWLGWAPKSIEFWLSVLAWAGLLVQFVYRHWSALFLTVQRAKLFILNSTIEWALDIRVELESSEEPSSLSERLENLLQEKYRQVVRLDRRDSFEFAFRIDRKFSGQIEVAEATVGCKVSLTIANLNIGFRDSLQRLKADICPFLATLEENYDCPVSLRKYGLQAYFRGSNPFFGVFVQALGIDRVDSFNLTLRRPDPERILTVSRDQLSLTTASLDALRRAIESTFSLSAAGA